MTRMEQEIAAQSAALEHTAAVNADKIAALATEIKQNNIGQIVVAARGSSDNACNYFKYLCEIYAGIPVSFAAPSVLTLYDGALCLKNAAVIGVSQSGAAADVIAVIERAKACGGVTAAITNNPDSPLAKAAAHSICMDVGEEKSVAATKTYTAQMMLLAKIADALSGGKLTKTLAAVPQLVADTVATVKNDVERAAARFKTVDNCYVLSRGILYAAGQECSLKIQETTYTHARAYAISDFHHGPFAVVGDGTHVVMLCADGKAQKDNAEMLAKLTAAGADVTLFTSDASLIGGAARVAIPKSDEAIAPFAFVVAGQLFALHLSLSRGLNPDAPRGLKKVTITK